jgi:hypothetical protein
VPTVIAGVTLLTTVLVIQRPLLPLSPAPLFGHDSKLDSDVVPLYVNARDMGRDQLLVAE